jgi:hypothetical protein
MSVVASVFDSEGGLDQALRLLNAQGIEGKDIHLMQGGSPQPGIAGAPLGVPAAVFAEGSGGSNLGDSNAAGIALAAASLDDMNITGEEQEYYRSLANQGSAVALIRCDEAQCSTIVNLLRRSGAARADQLA